MSFKLCTKLGVAASIVSLAGCASTAPIGSLYTGVTLPADATAASGGTKTGSAVCTSILALIATGDCSIEAAKRAGNISEVTSVDWQVENILGIYGSYTVIVKGN